MSEITKDARFWDRAARKYAKDPLADAAGYERTLARTLSYLRTSDAVLEFGCGTGTTALRLSPHVARYVASDISGEMLAIGREKALAEGNSKVSFEQAALTEAPWADGSFDAALGFNVLHLMQNRAAAFARLRRLLKPGGHLITKTPCISEMGPFVHAMVFAMRAVGRAPTVAFFTGAELQSEIEAAGFTIVERDFHGSKPKRDRRPFLVAQTRS